jgi:TetR/AcrR family transcriptional regulator
MTQTPSTQERILQAAVEVFAEDGFAGARIDKIAALAGCNKQLLYHHFGDKEALYAAVIEAELGRKVLPGPVEGSGFHGHLVAAFQDGAQERRWLRLMAWEALRQGEVPVVAEAQRAEIAARAVALVEDAQAAGHVRADLNTSTLLVAMMGLVNYPWMMPQVVRMMTGRAVDDPAFQEDYAAVLRALVPALLASKEER